MRILRRIWNLIWRSKVEREIDAELRSHIEMRTEDNMAAGMSREEAARDAQLRFGNPVVARERTVENDVAQGLVSAWRDVRFTLRSFAKSPGLPTIAVVTLALGIGANTAIFQLVNAVRLRSLPVNRPQELAEVKIVGGNRGFGVTNGAYASLTRPIWEQIDAHHDPFSGVFAWRTNGYLLGKLSEGRNVAGLEVSGQFFEVLGIQPWEGRLLKPEDTATVCTTPRIVLSYDFWQSQMGGQPFTPGMTLKVNDQLAEVVGITPPGFFGMAVGERFDIAEPLSAKPCGGGDWRREIFDVSVMGRLRPRWSLERASSYFGALSQGIFSATIPVGYSAQAVKTYTSFRLGAYPAAGGVSGLRMQYEDSLNLLLAITGLVLLIACANLANLMLARASARRREMAVRTALGASRMRLLRQLLVESGLLAIAGASLGLALAQIFSRLLVRALSTEQWQVNLAVATDWRVLLFALLAAVLTCLVFGTAPAMRASKSDPASAMKTGDGRVAGSSRERFSLQRLMVIAQIAISMVLLVGALLFVRSFRNLMTMDPGMREKGIAIVHVGFPMENVPPEQRAEYKRRLLEEARAVPGVTSAATTTFDPLVGGGGDTLSMPDQLSRIQDSPG